MIVHGAIFDCARRNLWLCTAQSLVVHGNRFAAHNHGKSAQSRRELHSVMHGVDCAQRNPLLRTTACAVLFLCTKAYAVPLLCAIAACGVLLRAILRVQSGGAAPTAPAKSKRRRWPRGCRRPANRNISSRPKSGGGGARPYPDMDVRARSLATAAARYPAAAQYPAPLVVRRRSLSAVARYPAAAPTVARTHGQAVS